MSLLTDLVVAILEGLPMQPDNAHCVHASVLVAMSNYNLVVLPEYSIKYGEDKGGRIDLVVLGCGEACAIELDCRRPRAKSLAKLRAFEGGRVLALRGVSGHVNIPGIDAVVPIAVRIETAAEEADKRIYRRAHNEIRGRA